MNSIWVIFTQYHSDYYTNKPKPRKIISVCLSEEIARSKCNIYDRKMPLKNGMEYAIMEVPQGSMELNNDGVIIFEFTVDVIKNSDKLELNMEKIKGSRSYFMTNEDTDENGPLLYYIDNVDSFIVYAKESILYDAIAKEAVKYEREHPGSEQLSNDVYIKNWLKNLWNEHYDELMKEKVGEANV